MASRLYQTNSRHHRLQTGVEGCAGQAEAHAGTCSSVSYGLSFARGQIITKGPYKGTQRKEVCRSVKSSLCQRLSLHDYDFGLRDGPVPAARILEKACVKLNDRQLMAQCNDMLRHQMVNCAATPAFLAAWTSLLKNTGDTAVTEQHRRAAESLVDTILEWVDNPQHGIREVGVASGHLMLITHPGCTC